MVDVFEKGWWDTETGRTKVPPQTSHLSAPTWSNMGLFAALAEFNFDVTMVATVLRLSEAD